jgi:hypothetical protein
VPLSFIESELKPRALASQRRSSFVQNSRRLQISLIGAWRRSTLKSAGRFSALNAGVNTDPWRAGCPSGCASIQVRGPRLHALTR